MSETIVNTATNNGIATLDGLAMQARSFIQGACMNLLQLGRVLTEAKPLVPFGGWEEWVRQNAKMSVRTAEQYMQAFEEFGLNAQIAELGTTKVFKLLPMPAEERNRLLQENDVPGMTTRQLDEAIRTQRERLRAEARREAMAEAQEAIQEAHRERDEAERRAADLAARPPGNTGGIDRENRGTAGRD